ncbi:DUF6350 family protein [Herbiconiux sp.]|uniref:cell division protein PerM n=1 Tax=Herbiconiux sp. TaxID=1871186 RepID=UPI0025BBBA6E|nr:DUF6350 family protein [Herbiconiux sp.]
MNRPVTALLSALDALIVVAIGVGIPLIPLTLLWAIQFELAVDWLDFWRASGDLWLLGNGVDLALAIDPALALQLGVAGAEVPFTVGIAPLGLALVTVLLGVRSGRRLGATAYPVTGGAAGVLAFAGLGLLVGLGSTAVGAAPSLTQAALLPALVYALGLVVGYATNPRRTPSFEFGPASALRMRGSAAVKRVDERDRGLLGLALRAGTIAAAAVVGFSALAMALILVTNFSPIVALYEGLQAGVLGGVSLTLAQLALLPNLIVWTASWFVGPGFALGTGSAVSPLGTQLGLVPALPVLGALPEGTPALGFVGLLVPVAAGFIAAAVLRPALTQRVQGRPGALWRTLATAGLAGAVGAGILTLLALASQGAAGPGRLADVGPDAGWVLLCAFGEFTVAMLLGFATGAVRRTDASRSAAADTL